MLTLSVSRCYGELGTHYLSVGLNWQERHQSVNAIYSTTAVLFDDKESDQKYKQRVAYVVSHELAHQWFGNLVTMDWWNEVTSRTAR
jgi:hypothetical protein